MNESNPYSAPLIEEPNKFTSEDRFQSLDPTQLKKLYHRSCNVNAITFLIGLGAVTLVVISLFPNLDYGAYEKFPFAGIAIFYAIAVFGLFKRTAWGRILGIIICIISLINIPIGTAIGAFGLFAFFGAPELFGANRVPHKELKADFKLQGAKKTEALLETHSIDE